MAKCKVFYNNENNRAHHDGEIDKFLAELESNGHTFLSINTISFGERQNFMDELRT